MKENRTLKETEKEFFVWNKDESIVLIGGGGGVYRIARFLKNIRPNITTIQTIFDHGGHSGILRDERGIIPPGDIMQAILALSDDSVEPEMKALLTHRFITMGDSSLNTATIRNLLFTAFVEINNGDVIAAIRSLCKIYKVKGKVLPVSLNNSDLCVKLSDGSELKGEGIIDKRSINDARTIVSASLSPEAHIYCDAFKAIEKADKIVFCPGDLFTSVIPNTLVLGFKEVIKKSRAKFIYVVNIMTKKAETHGFTASKFAKTLLEYVGRDRFDFVICNSGEIAPEIKKIYRKKERSFPVKLDKKNLKQFCDNIIAEDLADQAGGIVRHNERTTSIIAGI